MKHSARSKRVFFQALTASAFLFAPFAGAAEPAAATGNSVVATIGSGGLNLGYGKRFSALWGGRVLLTSGVKFDDDDAKIHDNKYDAEFKAGPGLSVLADLYPIRDSGFRVSGGLTIANYKTELANGKADSYSFNGHSYSAAQVGSLSGEVKYLSLAPYIGVGWESRPSAAGWRFVSDLGVAYLGKSSSKLEASGAASNAALQQDISAESSKLKESAVQLIANIGVSYAF